MVIVNLLEMVDVDHGEGQLQPLALRMLDRMFELLGQMSVIEQSRQAVASHAVAQAAIAFGGDRYRSDKLFGVRRLDQEIVAAHATRHQLTATAGFCRKENDRNAVKMRVLANHARDLVAGALRHVDIHQNDVGLESLKRQEHIERIAQRPDLHAGIAQNRTGPF